MWKGRKCRNSKLNVEMIPHVRDGDEYAEITVLHKTQFLNFAKNVSYGEGVIFD
jgi:hypothetical protein